MKHIGDLVIDTKAEANKYAGVTEVTGCLYINAHAKLDALTSVGGDLSIYVDAKLDAPALTSVGGYLSINAHAKLDAPALTSVGGCLFIRVHAKLDAPALYAKGFSNFKVFDGIACAVMSTKERGGIEILSCRGAKIENQRIVGDKFFVAKKGSVTAHAEDVKTALEELAFKLGDRDIEQYRNMPRTTRKAPDDWAFVYRMVTGACQYGTKSFMASKGKLKKTYTLAEIIEHTTGAYGHEKFRSVVCGKE